MVSLDDVQKYAKDIGEFIDTVKNKPNITLDNIDLLKRHDKNGIVKEIRSIHNLSAYGGRKIVELPIPGSVGNVFQDMGRSPLVISFNGSLMGPNAIQTLRDIKEKFELGKPVRFSSGLPLISDVDEVIIEKLNVHFESGITLCVQYSILLKEYSHKGKNGKGEKEPPSLLEKASLEVGKMVAKVAIEKLGV